MNRLSFTSSSSSSSGIGAAVVRLAVAIVATVFALCTAALLLGVALLIATVGLVRRVGFALIGRPATPWLAPLLLRLLQRTRWSRFVPAGSNAAHAAAASAGAPAMRRPATDDVTDVAVKAWRK